MVPEESAVRALDETGGGVGAVPRVAVLEGMKLEEAGAVLVDRKDDTVVIEATLVGRSIKRTTVKGLDEAAIGVAAIHPIANQVEVMNHPEAGAVLVEPEDGTVAVGAAQVGCSVEGTVRTFYESGTGIAAVLGIVETEAVDLDVPRPVRLELEDDATTIDAAEVLFRKGNRRRPRSRRHRVYRRRRSQ